MDPHRTTYRRRKGIHPRKFFRFERNVRNPLPKGEGRVQLRHESRRLDVIGTVSNDELRRLIVVLAYELETFSRSKSQVETAVPRSGVCTRIVDGDLVLDRVEIRSSEFLDHVQLLSRGHS